MRNNIVDLFANFLQVLRASRLTQLVVSSGRGGEVFKLVEVGSLLGLLGGSLLHVHS